MNTVPRFPLCFVVACWLGGVSPASIFGQQAGESPANLLTNVLFEKGTENWESHTWGQYATIERDSKIMHADHASTRIDHPKAADSFFNQEVVLKPATRYRLAGWIKVQDVHGKGGSNDTSSGASLALLGFDDKTEILTGTKDWTYVTTDFTTSSSKSAIKGLKLGPRLGYYGKPASGSAWFADVTLIELGEPGKSVAVAKPPVAESTTKSPALPSPNSAAPPATEPVTTANLVRNHRGNLVFVTMPEGAGSGFIANYGPQTFLITNAHVAAEAKGAVFKTLDGTQIQVGKPTVAVGHDIFLMSLPPHPSAMQVMDGVDEHASIGDSVVVLGNAEGAGVINTIEGQIVGLGPNLVEIDAPFQPGNSGSPIVHLKTGKVIGVATYLTIRKYDNATKEPIKEPAIRRFGYRLDSVKQWQAVNWPTFYAEAAEMKGIETLTNDLVSFLNELGNNGRVDRGAHTNPVIKSRIDAWIEAKSKRLSPSDATTANQSFLSFLRITCQTDVANAQRRLTYDYFQRQLADQQKERTALASVFSRIIESLR